MIPAGVRVQETNPGKLTTPMPPWSKVGVTCTMMLDNSQLKRQQMCT